jgi:hypothetical protein
MNNKFDELAKELAQSVTRRQAFKKLGVGVAGMVLACFGLADKAEAAKACLPEGSICGYPGDLPCCPGSKCIDSGYGGFCRKGRR